MSDMLSRVAAGVLLALYSALIIGGVLAIGVAVGRELWGRR